MTGSFPSNFQGEVWVPDDKTTFRKGKFIDYIEDGKKCKVQLDGSSDVNVYDCDKIEKCNPPAFTKCDDMASLTYLNEPSILHNLKLRYKDDNIYTYSGLFLVAINPYKTLNIYNKDFIKLYRKSAKKDKTSESDLYCETATVRGSMKPHIFSVAEEAYENLLSDSQDQSILVTGESGAGKTENTKKVIQYILGVSTSENNREKAMKLEAQIMQANPILESFGNATTVRNLNSSRFGKFVKVNILTASKEISGSHIDWYLLEKSRVVMQEPGERNYHAFYELLSGASNSLLKKLDLLRSIGTYNYLRKEKLISIDDKHEFENLEEALDTMNFGESDKLNVYNILSVILHLGNITFRNPPNDNRQAIMADNSEPLVTKIAELLSVSGPELKAAFLKSRAKAGREIIVQNRTASQAKFAIDALSKGLYERLFQYLVDKINETFDNNRLFTMEKSNYIGILDIAGFEIFKKNSFEQLCINYTNEKLQQFFNHHMFVLEQSEYLKEGISWQYIDFGQELKPTIELIEGSKNKKCSIFSILDEECIVPEGTNDSFLEKLFHELETRDKKTDKKKLSFKPNKVRDGFIVKHYAGEVSYFVDGWLDKNKDPLSSTVVDLLAHSKNTFVSDLFDSPELLQSNLSNSPVKGGRQRKSARFRTVAQRHKEQLGDLMTQLSHTHPHFVRCILPNSNKKPGEFNNRLVLDQLRCNGVLEGIRIARSGYPNRVSFEQFAKHYAILSKRTVDKKSNYKNICELILKDLDLGEEVYKIGITKLFFRNGVLASIEKVKQEKLNRTITNIEAIARGIISRRSIMKKIAEYRASKVILQNFKSYNKIAQDPWFKLIMQLRPTLSDSSAVESHYIEKIQALETKVTELTSQVQGELKSKEDLQKKYDSLNTSVSGDRDLLNDKDEKLAKTQKQIVQLEKDIQAKKEKLDELLQNQKRTDDIEEKRQKLESELLNLKNKYESQKMDSQKVKKELESLKNSIKEKEDVILQTKKKLSENKMNLDKSLKEKEDVILQTKKKLSENKMNLDKSLKETKSRLSTLSEENTKLKNLMGIKESSIKEYRSQVRGKDAELVKLKADFDKIKSQPAQKKVVKELADLKISYKQLNHDFKETKNLLDSKIREEIDFDKGKQKYDKEISDLREHLNGLKQELSLEKKLTQELQEELDDQKTENEGLMMEKKKHDVKLAEYSFKLSYDQSKKPLKEAHLMDENSERIQDEIEMLQTRLAAESYENRQLRAKLRKASSAPSSARSSLIESRRSSIHSMGSLSSTKSADSIPPSKELLLERAANKRLERLNVELQRQLLLNKNSIRKAEGLKPLEDDFKVKFQLAQLKIQNLQERLGQGQEPSLPLRNVDKEEINNENILNGSTLDKSSKQSLLMRQENLRLSARLNELQTKLKRLQVTSSSTFIQQEELAKLKSRVVIIDGKNKSLQESIDFYKTRAENYYNKIEAAEVAVQSAKRAQSMTEDELEHTKQQLDVARKEFKESDTNVAQLATKIRDIEKELSDRTFELKKVKEAYDALKDKYENSEELRASTTSLQSESRDKELSMLNKSLIGSMNKETELRKQVKNITIQMEIAKKETQSLKFSNAELSKEKDGLSKQLKECIIKRDMLARESKEYSMKVTDLTSQTKALKTANENLSRERDDLLKSKKTLERKVEEISAEFEKHLEKTKKDASNAVSVVQLRDELKESKSKISSLSKRLSEYQKRAHGATDTAKKMKKEALMIIEENKALTKYNANLRSKIEDAESKYNEQLQTQNQHWTKRVQELEDKLYMSNATKRDDEQKVFNLQRTIKDLEQHSTMQNSSIKRYTDQVDYLQKTVDRMDSKLSEMQRKDAENVLNLKRARRQAEESKEKALMMEKELLQWKMDGVSV